jgi:chemotaxis protein histidine kinase CheA
MGINDVFEEALSAMSYMENEKEPEFDITNSDIEAETDITQPSEEAEEFDPIISQEEIPQEDISQADITQEDMPLADITQEEISQEEIPLEDITQEDMPPADITQEDMPQDIRQDEIPQDEISHEDVVIPDELLELMEQTIGADEEESSAKESDSNTEKTDDGVLEMSDEAKELPQEIISDSEEQAEDAKESEIKPSVWGKIKSRFFDNIVDEDAAEKEKAEAESEAQAIEKKKEKAAQAAADKEENKTKKQDAKELKKKEKADKAAEKKEKLKEKKKKQLEEAAKQPVGRINPIGALIVFLIFITIGIFVYFGMQLISHKNYINEAKTQFSYGNYTEAYSELAGISLSDSEEELFQRTKLLASLQQKVIACDEYSRMNSPLEALNNLVKGVKKYNETISDAESLNIKENADRIKKDIIDRLRNQFGLSEADVNRLNGIESVDEYTNQLGIIVGS